MANQLEIEGLQRLLAREEEVLQQQIESSSGTATPQDVETAKREVTRLRGKLRELRGY